MIHSFLLIGQSNMGGRGRPEEVEPIVNDRIRVLRNGRWQPMFVPINPDRKTAGINLAESFADAWTEDHEDYIGLIPCADSATAIYQWMPGELLFDHAVMQCRLAQRTSELAGILWHQGEADTASDRYPVYGEKCLQMFRALRQELGQTELPVLVGGLGDYLADFPREEIARNYPRINEALLWVEKTLPRCRYVPAEGLTPNPDHLHINAASLREFGRRYYEKYKELEEDQNVVSMP